MPIIVTTMDNTGNQINTEVDRKAPVVAITSNNEPKIEENTQENIEQEIEDNTEENTEIETSNNNEQEKNESKDKEENVLDLDDNVYYVENEEENKFLIEFDKEAEPEIDNFDTTAEYQKALAKYLFKQEKRDSILAKREEAIKKESQRIIDNHNKRVKDAEKRYADFKEVTNKQLELTLPMQEAILTSKISGDLVYYFFKNEEEYKNVLKQSPINQAKYVAKIEAKLESQLGIDKNNKIIDNKGIQDKKVTNAPAPIKPVQGTSTKALPSKDPSKMDYRDYRKLRLEGKL